MADNRLLEKGSSTSELSLTKLGVGAGLLYQVVDQAFTKFQSVELKPSEIVSMSVSNVSTDGIIQLTEALKANSESYTGVVFALILSLVYVGKRAVLKYFELKGMVAIEIAKTQIEIESMKANARKEVEATLAGSERVEAPSERGDINIS